MELPKTIKETQKGLLDKEFSASELVDEYLKRIEKYKVLNTFLTVCADKAFEQARYFDDSNDRSEYLKTHLLGGIVVAHKDLFLTKGIKTTAASKVLESFVPEYSATVVKRMDDAGSIMIGKTNLDAWAHGSSGENSDFGPTKNPWNKEFTPGGSSSGSGAALAANLCLISTGTDTCGSIRLPANYCYEFSLKPTYGVVSRYGIIAMASSLDCPGPIGRTVEDIETVFNVIKGPDYFDSTVKEYEPKGVKDKLRIGIPKEFFVKGIDKEVENKVLEASKLFEKQGIEIIDVSLPSTRYAIDVYYIIQPAEVSSNLGRFDGIRYGNSRDLFGAEAKRRIMLGTYVLSAGYYDAYYLKAQKVRSKIINEVDEVFEKVDAIIAPVAPTPPFKLGEKTEDPLTMYLTDIYAATANLCGIPSLAVPYGFSEKGLPMGFQIMGPRFSEETLFALGNLFQKVTNYVPKLAI